MTETLNLQDRDETETFQKTSRDRLETETFKTETTSPLVTAPAKMLWASYRTFASSRRLRRVLYEVNEGDAEHIQV